MALRNLTPNESAIVLECVRASAVGPFFPDWEFSTLFGLERSQVGEVASAWPNVDDTDPNVEAAINGSLNNLLGYPHGCEKEWATYISATRADVERIFHKWRRALGENALLP